MVFYVWIGFLYTVVRFSSAYSIEVEPKCSKYDFEEKLLEKMIRLEHSTGIMMERFNDLSEKVENDLSTMKQEFNGIKLQVKADQGHYRKIAKGKNELCSVVCFCIKDPLSIAIVGYRCIYVTGPTSIVFPFIAVSVSDTPIIKYSWLSLSRPRLSRITAYLEVKIWSLPINENLTTDGKYCRKEEKLLLILLFSTIFSIYL